MADGFVARIDLAVQHRADEAQLAEAVNLRN